MLRVLILFFLWSCSNQSTQSISKLPSPGQDHLSQIYVLIDQSGASDFTLSMLSAPISEKLTARLEVKRPQNVEEASEMLKVWSARSIDLLIIGGEKTIRALGSTPVSFVGVDKVLVLGALEKKQNSVFSLIGGDKFLSEQLSSFCRENKAICEKHKEKLFAWSSAPGASNYKIRFTWDWVSFLRGVLTSPQKQEQSVVFGRGYLSSSLSQQLSEAEKNKINLWLKAQALQGLSVQ